MEARFFAPVRTGPGAHPTSCTMGTGSFPGLESGRGVILTPHPPLVPWSRNSRAIPVLLLRAVRPVQSLSACTRVHFNFLLKEDTNGSVPITSSSSSSLSSCSYNGVGPLVHPFRYHTSRSRSCGLTWSLVPLGVNFLFPKHPRLKVVKLMRIYPAVGS